MVISAPKSTRLGRRLLLRGESLIASTGLMLAVILMVVMAASAYWTLRVQKTAMEQARGEELRSLGELLSETAGLMLSVDELSTLRRLVTNVARSCDLSVCRIVLPGERVLAAADPSRITEVRLPPQWTDEPIATGMDLSVSGLVSVKQVVTIRGRGHARLEIVAAVRHPPRGSWEAQLGIAVIGSIALLALLFLYRRLRARFLALGMIRESLLAVDRGDETPLALTLDDGFGREARAWNKLLAEKEELREKAMGTRVTEALVTNPRADRRLSEICDAMRQGVVIFDKKRRVTYANGAASIYLGHNSEGIIGATLTELVQDPQMARSLEDTVAAGARSWTCVEIDLRGKDINSVLRFCVRPLRRDDPGAAMMTVEDVTQQRVAEEGRSAFIAQVTHELRAPLTNIRLSAEMVIDVGAEDPQVRAKCLNVINQEALRLERVVNDMLSVSEMEAGTFDLRRDDVKLDEIFERLEKDYALQIIEKSISLEFNLPPKLPTLHGDREKITLALHNLLNNAVKYTPTGGRVVVNVDVGDDAVNIDVTDSGIGIAEPDMERIFEKFYRADDSRLAEITGSGLGLALTREVVRLHGGDVQVQSELNKGSTFTVILPVSARAA